jgi:hypothetical protein
LLFRLGITARKTACGGIGVLGFATAGSGASLRIFP